MIILDEVIAVAAIVIIILELIFFGLEYTADKIIAGILAFVTMYVIKLIGDKLFKRESMGGGDIKLMFLFSLYEQAAANVSRIRKFLFFYFIKIVSDCRIIQVPACFPRSLRKSYQE